MAMVGNQNEEQLKRLWRYRHGLPIAEQQLFLCVEEKLAKLKLLTLRQHTPSYVFLIDLLAKSKDFSGKKKLNFAQLR
jgi:hypothetical protein